MNRPLIRGDGMKAIEGQIDTFTDTHAGVANEEKDVATQIIAAEELLLQEFVLLCRECAWKSSWKARNVLAADQTSEFRKLFGPGQFVQDRAQSEKQSNEGCGRQHRFLRSQTRHPTEDMGFAAQLVEALHLRMIAYRDSAGSCEQPRGNDELLGD